MPKQSMSDFLKPSFNTTETDAYTSVNQNAHSQIDNLLMANDAMLGINTMFPQHRTYKRGQLNLQKSNRLKSQQQSFRDAVEDQTYGKISETPELNIIDKISDFFPDKGISEVVRGVYRGLDDSVFGLLPSGTRQPMPSAESSLGYNISNLIDPYKLPVTAPLAIQGLKKGTKKAIETKETLRALGNEKLRPKLADLSYNIAKKTATPAQKQNIKELENLYEQVSQGLYSPKLKSQVSEVFPKGIIREAFTDMNNKWAGAYYQPVHFTKKTQIPLGNTLDRLNARGSIKYAVPDIFSNPLSQFRYYKGHPSTRIHERMHATQYNLGDAISELDSYGKVKPRIKDYGTEFLNQSEKLSRVTEGSVSDIHRAISKEAVEQRVPFRYGVKGERQGMAFVPMHRRGESVLETEIANYVNSLHNNPSLMNFSNLPNSGLPKKINPKTMDRLFIEGATGYRDPNYIFEPLEIEARVGEAFAFGKKTSGYKTLRTMGYSPKEIDGLLSNFKKGVKRANKRADAITAFQSVDEYKRPGWDRLVRMDAKRAKERRKKLDMLKLNNPFHYKKP